MKPTLTRRYRRRHSPAKSDTTFFKKESQQEQAFFGDASHDTFFAPAISTTHNVQRKCDNCEKEEKKLQRMEDNKEEEKVQMKKENKEEEKIHMKEAGQSNHSPKNISNYISSLNGKGEPLSAQSNQFFSSRMGYDFSNVKIHTGKDAAASAKVINAKAYTVGNNIVFNDSQLNTETRDGKKLMAHELAHVTQQGAAQVQRKPGDKHDLTSTVLSGNDKLEKCFDNETIIKKFAKGDHVKKIQEALIQLGISLPKFGADGDYGTETENGVKDFQQQAQMSKNEWDGIVGRKTIGLMDMSLRDNSISKDEDTAATDFVLKDPKQQAKDASCDNKPKDEKCPDPNTDVNTAAEKAIKIIDKVLAEQLPPVKNDKADYPAIFSLLFRFNDSRAESEKVKEVKTNFEDIKKFIGLLITDKSHSRCATDCDGGCRAGSPAYHFQNDKGVHIITFCPSFKTMGDPVLGVMHESHHAAISGSDDIAYTFTRLVEKLEHTKALLNAATFELYAGMVNDPTSVTIGQPVKDKNTMTDNTKKNKVDLALAFLEQWFTLVTFDMSGAATEMADANTKGSYQTFDFSDVIDVFHKWFETPPSPAKPSKKDVTKAKAVEERSVVMEKAFRRAFSISESADESTWERGPGTDIKLNKQIVDLDINHLVIALLQELVHATPDISAESEPLYVGSINDIRNRRSLDP